MKKECIVVTPRKPPAWRCIDCKCQAWRKGEDFYVHDKLWKKVVPEGGIICIKCFEERMGRRLRPNDFKRWFRNNRWWGNQKRKINNPPSKRLQDRLGLRA